MSSHRDRYSRNENKHRVHGSRTPKISDSDRRYYEKPSQERSLHYSNSESSFARQAVDRNACNSSKDDRHVKNVDSKPSYDIDWQSHKYQLDEIFFRDDDYVKKGAPEYDDFWAFLHRYQAFQRKRSQTSAESKCTQSVTKFDLPRNYDKRYRINVSLLSKDKYRVSSSRDSLTTEQTAYFRGILLHYIDFLQKQKFAKLKKIKQNQKNLPINEHRDEILNAIVKNQVVVVAGDTGCGKSTQVPQYLLSAGFTNIACTQPRRIACISLSRRVAFETLNEYGSEVAYQVTLMYCLL